MTHSRSHSLEQAARHHLLCEHFLVLIPFQRGLSMPARQERHRAGAWVTSEDWRVKLSWV
jgi:hypothetical protein